MPEKLDRCVAKVKGQKGVDNAYAICNASLKEIKDDDDDPICRHCGKPESEHGLFTKHDFEEDVEHDDEYESGITIIIKEQEKEAVAIGGGLSAVSIGGKKKTQEHHNPLDIPFGKEVDEIEACPEFDKIHEALMHESYSFENKAGDSMSGPVDEGGEGSGEKGHTTAKDLPFGQEPQGRGNIPSPFRVSKVDAMLDDIRQIGGQTTTEDWAAKTGEDPTVVQNDLDKLVQQGKLNVVSDPSLGNIYSIEPFEDLT